LKNDIVNVRDIHLAVFAAKVYVAAVRVSDRQRSPAIDYHAATQALMAYRVTYPKVLARLAQRATSKPMPFRINAAMLAGL
jgi:hypothetical protein